MKITVDLAVCQGYARRAFLAPDAFRIYGEEAFLYSPQPGDRMREWVLQAAGACPVRAMAVENGAAMSVSSLKRIVIVGASLAGPRGAEALRREGFRER